VTNAAELLESSEEPIVVYFGVEPKARDVLVIKFFSNSLRCFVVGAKRVK
jgi:hypothetical protein